MTNSLVAYCGNGDVIIRGIGTVYPCGSLQTLQNEWTRYEGKILIQRGSHWGQHDRHLLDHMSYLAVNSEWDLLWKIMDVPKP